jgi:hypothetical protein
MPAQFSATCPATINLCLGILYAWSVWKVNLVAPKGVEPDSPMSGLNEGRPLGPVE